MSEPTEGTPGEAVQAVQAAVLAGLRGSEEGLDPLGRLCRACVDLLPVDGASIAVISDTAHRETLYASNKVSASLESIQFTLGEGPCFEAFTTRRPVLVPDLAMAASAAWPVFAAEIADLPVAAIFAFPIHSGAISIGAMDLYRSRPGPLTSEELSTALQVVDVAATALLGLHTVDEEGEEWLAALPPAHAEVHQATGMLTFQLQVPPGEALARLRGHAFATGRLVEDVAREIIARRLDLTDS